MNNFYQKACATAAIIGVTVGSYAQVTVDPAVDLSEYIEAFATAYAGPLATAIGVGFGFLVVWRAWGAARRIAK